MSNTDGRPGGIACHWSIVLTTVTTIVGIIALTVSIAFHAEMMQLGTITAMIGVGIQLIRSHYSAEKEAMERRVADQKLVEVAEKLAEKTLKDAMELAEKALSERREARVQRAETTAAIQDLAAQPSVRAEEIAQATATLVAAAIAEGPPIPAVIAPAAADALAGAVVKKLAVESAETKKLPPDQQGPVTLPDKKP